MKTLILFLALVALTRAASANVREFQAQILNFRVIEILNFRGEGLTQCARNNRPGAAALSSAFHGRLQRLNLTYFTNYEERLVAFLDLLSTTENTQLCRAEIAAADDRLRGIQRSKFKLPAIIAKAACLATPPLKILQCRRNVDAIIKELDPFCATQNSNNYFGVKDPNPCMAGDKILADTLRKSSDPDQDQLREFLDAFEQAVKTSRPGTAIDLWQIYLQANYDDYDNRKRFLGMMNFFYYAMGTAGGYLDGIADHYWLRALGEGNSSGDVFGEFFALRQKIDRYGYIIKKLAKNRNLTFLTHGRGVEGLNRHDFMSMFLACHFKAYGPLVSSVIPKILGVGYESLDFVSHIRGNVGVRNSAENFRVDTNRYMQGSNWGQGFCSFKF